MGSEGCNLKMLFFPFMAQGHMLPMVDMAKLFAAHGVKTTILTTPGNVPVIRTSIDHANASYQHPIELHSIPFPSNDVGLPDGCKNFPSLSSLELSDKFFAASGMLKDPFARALEYLKPDFVVTDMFYPWTCNVVAEHGIPRLVFHGFSFFALSVCNALDRHKPTEGHLADEEPIVIPEIPHRIEMLRSHIMKPETAMTENIFNQMKEIEACDYGTVVNSFYELEPDYVEYYRNVVRRRAWHVGPLSLCNSDIVNRSGRGKEMPINQQVCLQWLDGRSPGSVVYVCFGSIAEFSMEKLHEIALALEASNHSFIWVVRGRGCCGNWIPEGFDKRIEGKSLIVRGWASQILILNQMAIGGFVTHCGWNSCLEAISAGGPLVTWPLFAEQFYNEKLVVDVLKIGVAVGAKDYGAVADGRTVVEARKIKEAVDRLMGDDEEAEKRRERARELRDMANKAVEKDGSSYNDISNLIQELMDMKSVIKKQPIDIHTNVATQ